MYKFKTEQVSKQKDKKERDLENPTKHEKEAAAPEQMTPVADCTIHT